MAWLMVMTGDQERAFQLDEDFLFVGAAEDCALRVEGEGILPRHCQILRAGDSFKVLDLGGPAGTLLNGEPVSQQDLQEGDVIQVGERTMTFHGADSAAAPTRAATPPAASGTPSPSAAPRRSSSGRRPTAGARGGAARGSAGRGASGKSAGGRSAGGQRRAGAAGGRGRSAHTAARKAMHARGAGGERGEQPMIRRNLRKPSGLPAPYLYGLIVLSVLLTSFVVWKVVSQKQDPITYYLAEMNRFKDAGDQDNAAKWITKAKEEISEGHKYYDRVQEEYRKLVTARAAMKVEDKSYEGKVVFLNNIEPFWKKYIDTDDEQYKDDPTTARYFVEFRLEVFLTRFPTSEYAGQVRAWISQLERRYNKADPFPTIWWDYELIWAMEERLEHHGYCYGLMQTFLQKHPDHKHFEEAQDKMGLSLSRARKYWNGYVVGSRLQPALEATKPNYKGALTWALKGWQNLKGIPELETEIRRKAEEIQRVALADNFEISLDAFQ